ncbi:hypothetical protein KAFR_0C01610 [Kazachstania africana CBS 2517]|uniref:polynucleotide adenylyltransferase n=1 Tax=Kazachstania africana (strain ATCC 22294 / BCRC 22015 / CBS 2517 / CECT 1963 / NBRC 1671 / NRRL Y-8276) TaxID=1071382 RepID=H2AS04_KAZAF|nr:hypothetical protein KAFR_0C01610 [Kazachstania africana CBS 2517]CCF57154.1 hypothetical protein KAFR_0C01610 [Kazachstania africana CBS 2517]
MSQEGANETTAVSVLPAMQRKYNQISNNDDIVLLDDTTDSEGYDDYDGHFDNPTESASTVEVPALLSKTVEVNELSNNKDFIAFSSSSEDENETKEKASERKSSITSTTSKTASSKATKESQVILDYPWIVNHDHSKQKEVADWLTLEMKDFVSYISPSSTEIEDRNITISRIRDAVKELWPDADLHVFGSYSTDLYLPGSDIDCVVNSERGNKDSKNCLYQLAKFLTTKKLATDVEVVSKARVPIIKFVEPHTGIHIDVSFERTNGLEAAKLIRSWLDSTAGLRELVLVIKQFLHARRLNNVHTGGLGGFSIICLVFTFLHMHPRIITNEIDPIDNLGVLLIDFFELYGKNFGYDDVAISVLNGHPSYIPKYSWRELQPIRNSFALAIQDPGDATNNISRGSFNIRDIKKAFAGAFDLLTNRCFDLDKAAFKERSGKSILGNVIKYKGKQRDFKDERNLVINTAIVENEDYHKKRSRIVYETITESTNDSKEEEDDDYHIEEPTTKNARPLRKKEEGEEEQRNKTGGRFFQVYGRG